MKNYLVVLLILCFAIVIFVGGYFLINTPQDIKIVLDNNSSNEQITISQQEVNYTNTEINTTLVEVKPNNNGYHGSSSSSNPVNNPSDECIKKIDSNITLVKYGCVYETKIL